MSLKVNQLISPLKAIGSASSKCFKKTNYFLGRTAKKLDGLDKCFKCIIPIGDLWTHCLGSSQVYTILKGEMKIFGEFVGVTNLFSRIKEWTDEKERAKFLKDWQLTVQKVTLTIATFLDSVKFLETIKLINLGKISCAPVQLPIFGLVKLSPLGLVKDSLISTFLIFSTVEQFGKYKEANAHSKKAEIDLQKAAKWKAKGDRLLPLSSGSKKDLDALKKCKIRAKMWHEAFAFHSGTKPKLWITVGNNVSKVALIAFATVGITFLGMTSGPAMVAFLTLGVIGGGLGYGKFLYDENYNDHKERLLKLAAKSNKQTAVV